ncbi:MAG: hypothetical protein I3J02_07640 [Prevotella sp.]|nr:hypothetical protein [Prevotella sp.]
MIKAILSSVVLSATLSLHAQTADTAARVLPRANLLRGGVGYTLLTSKFYVDGHNQSPLSGTTFSLDYEHVWDSGYGFGLNVSHTQLPSVETHENYLGASLVLAHTTDAGWRWDTAFGLGYVSNNVGGDMPGSGIGMMSIFGVTYKLSAHWGLGSVLRMHTSRYSMPAESTTRTGFSHYDLQASMSYLF